MASDKNALKLTIAYKILMAVTGLILIGFLVVHLMGNLLLFVGAETLNQYGLKLREYPYLLWSARLVLFLSVVSHIYAAIKLSLLNKAARPVSYAVVKPVKSSFASRTMLVSGCIVLFFILYHLAHFTFKWTHRAMFAFLDDHDVFSMVVLSFQSPWVTGFYFASVLLLMLHLNHGMKSFFQTLGVNHVKYNRAIQLFGPLLGIGLACGFLAVPLSIFFKFVE